MPSTRSFADETVETSNTTGTGTYALEGPKGDYFPFGASFVTGDMPVYGVRNPSNTKIELNRGGVYTAGSPATLARSVWKSTNDNAPISWTADDLPLTIYIPASAELHEGVVTGWLAAARHALLRAGSFFFTTADVAVSWVHKLATTAAAEIRIAYYDVAKNAYFPDNRRRFVDNGAANLVMTADHIGQTIKFDVTAAGRTLTLLAGATAGVGAGFPLYVRPYGGNNCVSIIPDAAQALDGGAVGVALPVPAGRITAIWWDDVAGAWQTDLASGLFPDPLGRLTLESGAAVSTSDQAGKTVVYYTPHRGGFMPLRAGAGFAMVPFSELSNDLTQSTTGKAGPAAAGPYQVIDLFVWSDAGTIRLTRGPKWLKSAPATMTIATPCVVTWAGHGLYDGATVRFTTTGALATGLTANTDYFVTYVDANTFKLSTTLANQVAGTFINTTGSQSGVHTAENYTTGRGTGAGTTELDVVNGIRVNKVAITNGPAAGQGVYLGSIYANGSSQVDFKMGSVAANGGEAFIGLWNAYNRVEIAGFLGDSSDSWPYATAAFRPAHGSQTMRVSCLQGLQAEWASLDYKVFRSDASSVGYIGIGYNSTSLNTGRTGFFGATSVTLEGAAYGSAQPLGLAYLTPLERGDGTGTSTWFGDNATTYTQSGASYRVRY